MTAGGGQGAGTSSSLAGDGGDLHPRLRERRDEVKREEGRRRRHRIMWLLAPVVMVLVALGLAHTPLLDVDRIEVEGAERTSEVDIETASGVILGEPLLTLDEGAAEGRIRELPWIEEAAVAREWPATVRITVTERSPAALVDSGDPRRQVWVDASGRVLQVGGHLDGLVDLEAEAADRGGEAPGGAEPALVTIVGVADVPAAGDDLPEGASDALAFAALAPERVPGVLATISTDLEAVITDGAPGAGAVVDFRDGRQVVEKLVALHTILYSGRLDADCLETIDLWVPDTPSFTRRC